jgi:hypothetical protein
MTNTTIHSVWANQGWRDCTELARIGDEVLVEYEMPNGTTALRVISLAHYTRFTTEARIAEEQGVGSRAARQIEAKDLEAAATQGRSVSYTKLPKRWVRAMHDAGTTEWIGLAQGYPKVRVSDWKWEGRVPFPALESDLLTPEGK